MERKKIKTYKLKFDYYKQPPEKPEMMAASPFIASFKELGSHARGKEMPHKHTSASNKFGLLTKTDERF